MSQPPVPDNGERRREERIRTRLQSAILYGRTGQRLTDCLIQNRSTHGAKLLLPEPVLLPLELILEDEADHRRYAVRIIRREGREIGVVIDDEVTEEGGTE